MRQSVWFIGLVSLVVAGCKPSVNVEQERNALIELDRAWSQSASDLEKFLTYLAPDASIYPPGTPIVTGSGAIREFLTSMFSMPGFSVRWEPTKAEVSTSGDLGYTAGAYIMTFNTPAGTPMTERGKYLTFWKKQADGQWKVMEESFNADTTPPPPSEAQTQ